MYNVHLLTTNDRILPPPNLGANLTWERLTDTLRRDLGAEAADLLAEPVQDGERKETRWYVQAVTDPVPISDLSPSERETVFRRLSEVRSRIETYAEGLDKAGGNQRPPCRCTSGSDARAGRANSCLVAGRKANSGRVGAKG